MLLPVCFGENGTNIRDVKTFNQSLGGESSPENVEVIAEKGFAKTNMGLTVSLGSSSLGHLQGLRLNPVGDGRQPHTEIGPDVERRC